MKRARIVLLALAAAAALTLAACDGDAAEDNDYVDQVNEISEELQASVTEVTSAGGDDPSTIGPTLEKVAAETRIAADELAEVDPPDDVADLHDQMVADIEALAAEAQKAADAVAKSGPGGAVGALGGFVTQAGSLGADIDSTISEINSKLQE